MKIRGERECQNCGCRWSYYETGAIDCPECGSIRSVGVDDRTEHTDNPATLELQPVISKVEGEPVREVAKAAAEATSEYVRRRGFIRAGEIQPLDATFVAAVELRAVARHLGRAMRVEDEEELYFLSQLRGADSGERPPPSEVPNSLAPARGLAAAAVVDHYRRDCSRYLDDHPDDQARKTLGTLVDHKKRVEALDGNVEVQTAEALVQAVTDLSHYVAYDDEQALARARERLDGLA
jgi:uncharacterized Zn finger protein (UPF0148 family)